MIIKSHKKATMAGHRNVTGKATSLAINQDYRVPTKSCHKRGAKMKSFLGVRLAGDCLRLVLPFLGTVSAAGWLLCGVAMYYPSITHFPKSLLHAVSRHIADLMSDRSRHIGLFTAST